VKNQYRGWRRVIEIGGGGVAWRNVGVAAAAGEGSVAWRNLTKAAAAK